MQQGCHKQKGYTMVELTLVIVAILTLIGVGIAGWGKVQEKARTTRLINTVTAIDAAVRTQYPSAFTYDGLTMTVIWPSLPGEARGAAATPQASLPTPWGNAITLAPRAGAGAGAGLGPAPNTNYQITIDRLPQGACRSLLAAVSGSFIGVETNNTTHKTNTMRPLSSAEIATACTRTTGGEVSGGGSGPGVQQVGVDPEPILIRLVNG